MVNDFDDQIKRFYEKYRSIIMARIFNYKIRNSSLVEDVINEVFLIALENLPHVRRPEAIDFHFRNYWIVKGIKNVLKKHFGNLSLLEPRQIRDFEDKVNFLIKTGYSDEEAREYVILDESLRNRYFVFQIQPKDNDPNWLDYLSNMFPKSNIEDIHSMREGIKFCLSKIKTRLSLRDFQIFCDFLSMEDFERQYDIANNYNISRERANQIIRRNLPFLRKCFCKYFELDKTDNYDCGELSQ